MENECIEKDIQNKITILFGAGADTAYGLVNGKDFAQCVIGLDEYENIEMKEAIKEFYNERVKDNNWYPNNPNLITQNRQKRFIKACLEKKIS